MTTHNDAHFESIHAPKAKRTAVILANTGTPQAPTPEAVGVYLEEFLSHPRICPMNPHIWKFILKHFIIPKRSVTSAEKYSHIWTEDGFKFLLDHKELAQKLTQRYQEAGYDVKVAVGMSFGQPSLPSVMKFLKQEGYERLLVLPLYPQNAFSQASIVADQAFEAAKETGWEGKLEVVPDYSANPRYLQAIADTVRNSEFDPSQGDRLLLSYHSVPMVDINNGDTYRDMTQLTSENVARLLGLDKDQWFISYQCRFDKERAWVSPFVRDVFAEIVKKGINGKLYMICPNFSVDCLETYYDIGYELQPVWSETLQKAGLSAQEHPLVYLPCLNASDAHVEVVMSVLSSLL